MDNKIKDINETLEEVMKAETTEQYLSRKEKRYAALNKHLYEFIQKNGHRSQTMSNELDELWEVVGNISREEMKIEDYEIRLTINYFINNADEELYNLSVAVKKNGKYVSIWTYFYSMELEKIAARIKEMDDCSADTYDIFTYHEINKEIQDTLLSNNPGSTLYWDAKDKVFVR